MAVTISAPDMRLIYLFFVILSACSYNLGNEKIVVLGKEEEAKASMPYKIFIPVVDNKTVYPGLENEITTALREAYAALPNVKMMNSKEEADYLLLATITHFNSRAEESIPVEGDQSSESRGGLAAGQITSGSVKIAAKVDATFYSKSKKLWTRYADQSLNYDTVRKFTEKEGASSAAHLNASRESIQFRILSRAIANQIVNEQGQDW